MWEVCGRGLAEVLLMAEKIFLCIEVLSNNIEVLSPSDETNTIVVRLHM